MSFLGSLVNAAQKRVGQAYNTGVHDVGAAAQAVGHGVANIAPHQAAPVLPQQGQVGFGVVRPGVAVMPQPVFHPVQATPSFRANLGDSLKQVGTAGTLGLMRVGTGLAQDASGLADLAGQKVLHKAPSGTTSRVDKALDRFAKNLDQTAHEQVTGPARTAYNITQGAGTAATFLAPTSIVKGATAVPKVAGVLTGVGEHTAPALKAISKATAPATKLAGSVGTKLMPGTDAVGRFSGAVVKGGLSKSNLLNATGATVAQVGSQASHGQNVNRGTVARDFGTNVAFGAGLSGAGQLAREAGPGITKTGHALASERQAANIRMNSVEASNNEKRVLQSQAKGVQRQMNQVPLGPEGGRATSVLLGKQSDLQTRLAANRASHKTIQNPIQTVTDRLLTAQPGLSMKAVHSPDLHPEQNNFIEEYAKMLKDQGQGNGVDMVKTADGYKRVSNNMRDASVKGESLNNSYWFDKARKELESGRGAYGASDEYKALSDMHQAPLEVPSEFNGIGKPTPAQSTTPALPRSRGAVSKPETPASIKKRLTNVGSQAKDTPDITKYAKAFGISKEQATHELSRINDKPVKTKSMPALKDKPASAAENTAKNPVKVSIPEVKPGNYEQARINPQIASHPVNYAAGQLLDAAKGTGLDTSTFGKMVEGDLKPRNAREAAAVQAYKDLTNRVHATSQALGGNTPYVENYFRHEWDLSNPEDAARFDKLATKSKSVDPYAFGGLDRQPRVFSSIAQGEAAGFKLKNPNLRDEVAAYGSGSAHALKQQALAKALTEADMGEANKPHTFDLGGGKNVLLSDKGLKEAKGYAKDIPTDSKVVKGYRRGNRGFKQMLLSVSQFHPVNISMLRAAPTLAAEFHPARAAKGLFDTFAAQAAPRYSAKLQTAAMRDGTLEASARLGTPIKFGSDYGAESKVSFGNGGLGEKAIFERAMPAMHIQMVKSAVADLKDAGLSLDSKEAHALGTRINEIMGFVNTEVRNLDRGTQRRLGDIFLAPQFTRSKWATNKAALSQGGLAGSYARRAVVSNAAAAAVVAMGVGYALHQKSDNTNDMLLRGVFHPSVPTPLKDKKGNTMELGLPATQSSEVLGLLGFSLKRKADGHLGIDWKGGNVPGNVANYGRSRLAVLPANVLKAATNTDYAGKPLYDPQANVKTKLEQGATTIGTGLLPIGGQGIVQTNAVKKHLPDGVQQVLNANTPGSNPLVKSIGSSFGLTPKTDKTVGKGLQTTQYFDAVDQATKGLNANDKAAYNAIHPQSKNPVSGTYQTAPTIYDSQQRATTYLKNPNVLAADNKLNQQLQKDGQPVDPFYKLNPDQQNIALNYSALAQGDTRRSSFQKAYPFLQQLSDDRNSFFSSLPASTATDSSGNSKATLPANLQYPSLSADEQALVDKYYSATSPTTKKQLLNDPNIASAVGKVKAYSDAIAQTRRVPKAEDVPGYTPPVPKNPVPSANTGNSVKTTYNKADNTWTEVSSKTGRTTVISADGTRTVTNAGVRTSSGRRSTSTGGRKASIKPVSLSRTKLSSYRTKPVKVPKVSLSGTISGRMRSYKQPTLKLRKNMA